MGIKLLDPMNLRDIKSAVHLHSTLIPKSPVVLLGSTFTEKFYYSKLVQHRLLYCDLYEFNGQMVGFIAYTKNPNFLKLGFQRYFLSLAYFLTPLFIQNPFRVFQLFRASQLNKGLKPTNCQEGFILSFGVLPEYRNHRFIRKTGLRISHELFKRAAQFFREHDVAIIKMLVEPHNKEALLFYHSFSCSFENITVLRKKLIKVTYKVGSILDYATR